MLSVTEGLELGGRYVVGQQIGAGGSGSVWKAHDRVLERPVAVKVVAEGVAAARLAREARATAGIGVRNVVAVYDVGEQEGAHYLVMEYIDGVDLATLLATTGPLSPELVAIVGRDVARGVAAVHDAELVHRDVKPANVLVTVEGEVKLTDLGIAQRTDDAATRRLTEVGTVVGTVDYLAPEQVEGHEVTSASDVYAVGLLLLTASTGRAPFGDGSVSERLARRLATDPESMGGDDQDLTRIVATATQRDPGDRYEHGRALAEDLTALVPHDEGALRDALAERVREASAADPSAVAERTDALEGIAIGQARAQDAGVQARRNPEAPAPTDVERDSTTVVPVTSQAEPTTRTPVEQATPGPVVPSEPAPVEEATPARIEEVTPAPVERASGGAAAGSEQAPSPAASDRDDKQAADGDRRGLLVPLVTGIATLLAVVAVTTALLGPDGNGGQGGEGGPGGEGQAGATAVQIVAAADHDPLGGGSEHPEDVPLAIDGDPDTQWDTEGYNGADLGGLKDGVGLLLDLGEPVDVATVEIDMGLAGATVVVVVAEARPDGDPTSSGTVLGTAEDTEGTVTVTGEPVTGRWVALWFTLLGDDGGDNRAAVREVRVLAP